jgi:hypothetical protein
MNCQILFSFLLVSLTDATCAESVRKVDYSDAPEMKGLAEHARQVGNQMYPEVFAILAQGTSESPRHFDIVFKKHLEGNVGQTLGTVINLRADWFSKNPSDLDATLIHEMSHVAQAYKSKAWDYWGEGIADYVCYKLGHTNEWNWPRCSAEYPHYTSGYWCTGAFLLFVDASYASNVVRQFNAELHRGSYSDKFFAGATGKSLDELWGEFQNTSAFTPAATEVAQLRAALGYLNGQPPRDIAARFKAYLEQQPGGVLTLEGADFLAELIKKNRLPGIFTGEHPEKVSVGVGASNLLTEARSAAYPASRTFYCKKADDPCTYHYMLVRAFKDAAWKLQKAWRTAPDERIVEEYPVR